MVRLFPLSTAETAAPSAAYHLNTQEKIFSNCNSFKRDLLKSATITPLTNETHRQLLQTACACSLSVGQSHANATRNRKFTQNKPFPREEKPAAHQTLWRDLTRLWELSGEEHLTFMLVVIFLRPAFAWLGILIFVLFHFSIILLDGAEYI